MKKLIFILALLVIAAPVWSAPVIVEVNNVTVFENTEDPITSRAELYYRYDAGVGQGLVRAFALELSITGPNAFIEGVWAANAAYEIAPGVEEGIVAVFGEENDGTWIIEQASLYNEDVEDGGVKPDANGMLLGMTVGGDPEGAVCVTVALNNIRGKIVLENVTQPGLISDVCCVTLAPYEEPPPECGDWFTEPQFAALEGWYVALEDAGLPASNLDNWCLECFGRGDQDGDGFITFNDFSAVFQDFMSADDSTDPNAADSDIDMDGFITFNDFSFTFQSFINDVNCVDLDGYPLE